MPWTTSDARIRSLPKPGRELWVRVANQYLEDHPNQDVSAIRIAWHAVGQAGYKKDEGEHKWSLSNTQEGVEDFTKNAFGFGGAPVTFIKAYTKDKVRHVVVKASGLKVDRQDERMDPSAIDDMTEACKAGDVHLLDNHYSSFEMGVSTGATVNEDGEMFVDFALNDTHPNNDQLYDECEKGICKRQASVGGTVTKARYEYNEALGKAVKVLEHVDLDHVAVTREGHSAYPDAEFVGAIMKAVHLEMPKFEKGGGTMKEFMEMLKGLAVKAAEVKKGLFQLTPDMLDDNLTLKAQFKEQLEKAAPKLSAEEKTQVGEYLKSILGALGIPTTLSKEAGHWNDEHLKSVQGAHMGMKHAIDAVEKHVAEAGTSALDDLKSHHEDMGKALKKMIDSGTNPSGKEEPRKPANPKDQKDGSQPTSGDGPGSSSQHQGNGSADAEKALIAAANALLEKQRKDNEDKLTKATADYEALKKDNTATTKDLTKAMLEIQEMKKDIAKLGKTPEAPRVGPGQRIVKEELGVHTDMRAVEAILKTVGGDPEGFMSKLEEEVNQLAKMKGSKSWTPEIQKEATRKAQILKDCKTMGPLAAMAKHGVKLETLGA